MSSFNGFIWPQTNWFRLPNNWTDITADITSLAELKILEYVLRHTWGYNERHRKRWITTDEFSQGRKASGGGRLDKGTGLSKSSIINGLKQAIADGFLLVFVDDQDKGRVKKRYQLNMKKLEDSDDEGSIDRYEEVVPRGIESIPRGNESIHRTEERHLKGKKEESKREPTRKTPVKKKKKAESKVSITQHKSKWTKTDKKYGARLRQIMVEHDTDLTHNGRITKDTYVENIYMVRTERGRSHAAIEELMLWYRRNYSDIYTPKLKNAYDFYSKFSSIEEAMLRKQENGNTQSEEDRRDEAETAFEHHYYTAYPMHDHLRPKESNEICKQLGLPPRYRSEGTNTWSRID